MGGGVDVLSVGDGNDTFEIAEGSDVSSGINLSGGATDTLSITFRAASSLVLPFSDVSFSTLEIFSLSGGAASGVSRHMTGDDLEDISQYEADGTTDALNVFTDDFGAGGLTFNGLNKLI